VGLLFKKEYRLSLSAHVDVDWGNCPNTRRSVTGYVVLINSQVLSWKATRQATVSLSSLKAEYKALSDLGQEIAWFANLILGINVNYLKTDIPVSVDNQGAIDLARSKILQNGSRTKHMDIRLHFVRELVTTKLIILKYIRAKMNSANFLTKPTGCCTIHRSLAAIGVAENPKGSAPCLPAQSTPGCRILSTDQNKNKKAVKRNSCVTTNGMSHATLDIPETRRLHLPAGRTLVIHR
jgi:hypothetical protein